MTTNAPGAVKLSIVIPTVNRAQLVSRALESALAQTADDIEIIVSDNGSADSTPAVLARYQDPRLRQFRHEQTMSATAHGNFLIEQSAGEFFLGLSDDDYIEPDFAARALELLARHRDLAFVYTGCLIHYGSAVVACLTGPITERGTDFIRAFLAGNREVCWCACVTRVADLRAIGPIPEGRIFGDMFYWTKLAFQGDIGCIAEPLAHYTFMTSDNLSSGVPAPKWARETQLLATEVMAAFGDFPEGTETAAALQRDCARFIARSTANQFVWNSIRGVGKLRLVEYLGPCLPFLGRELQAWPRVISALVLPGQWLRYLILRAAAKRAAQRQRP